MSACASGLRTSRIHPRGDAPINILRTLTGILLPALLAACMPAAQGAPDVARPGIAAASAEATAMTAAQDPGSGPDADTPELPHDAYHGSWRVVAADDPHEQALMAIALQSSAGEAQGSGDFVLFQPSCDAMAGQPIAGTSDCELIGMAAAFDQVQATPARIVLTFHPTADGIAHRLDLQRDGERLVGDYAIEGQLRRRVTATRSPESPP